MMSLGNVASRLPWPVFACDGDKRPLVKWRDECSRDPAVIADQFDQPNAQMIGVPTGRASGLVVIDVDVKNGARGQEWLDYNQDALPETRTHRTRSGGLHLVFRMPADVEIRNSASRVAPGIDVRGEGGYIVVPPSPGYAVADASEPAEMPLWLIRACLPPETPRAPVAPPERRHERYVQAALDAEVLAVSRAGEGTRNDTLNRAAVKLGTLVGAGVLSRSEAEAELIRAGQGAGLPYREIVATVKSGLDFGQGNPREMPEKAEPKPSPVRQPVPPVDAPTGGIRLVWFNDIQPALDANDFVQGVLTRGGASVLYGESNSGKTFFATDLALHVASGLEWRGKRVDKGGVVYCALEGGIGFRNRVAAWRADKELDGYAIPFAAIQQPLNLANPEADVTPLIDAVLEAGTKIDVPLSLVVIDTLSRALAGGNENDSADMGALVMCMDMIRQQTGAAVLFIHHSGKDAAKGARGHSLLRAAIDTEIEVTADQQGARAATVVKQRELSKGNVFPFTLRVIELGQNRHGEAVTTCVVDASDQSPVATRKLSGQKATALNVLSNLIAATGQTGHPGCPADCPSVPEGWWRDRFYSDAMPGDEQDTKKRAFRRAADELIGGRVVGMHNHRVWIISKGNNANA
jgi:hypothetical protein